MTWSISDFSAVRVQPGAAQQFHCSIKVFRRSFGTG